MNILFISYWGYNEGLSQSTVLPTVHTLLGLVENGSVDLVTVERKDFQAIEEHKFQHYPYMPPKLPVSELIVAATMPGLLLHCLRLHRANSYDLIVCRSSMAGAVGYMLRSMTGIPFIVESFEPHADYMASSGEWNRYGAKYFIQKWLEGKILKKANNIITVSENYLRYCLNVSPSVKAYCCPCPVDPINFYPDSEGRKLARQKYNLPPTASVGAYTGKFGGLYYSLQECLSFFEYFLSLDKNNYLLLLSNLKKEEQELIEQIKHAERIIVDFVPFEEVPVVLNAADFAYCLFKTTPYSPYCSPIKNGEYWATGLPILIPDEIGDDSQIIKEQKLGVICGPASGKNRFHDSYMEITRQAADLSLKERRVQHAKTNRSPERIKDIYSKILVTYTNQKGLQGDQS